MSVRWGRHLGSRWQVISGRKTEGSGQRKHDQVAARICKKGTEHCSNFKTAVTKFSGGVLYEWNPSMASWQLAEANEGKGVCPCTKAMTLECFVGFLLPACGAFVGSGQISNAFSSADWLKRLSSMFRRVSLSALHLCRK